MWLCHCRCGKQKVIRGNDLVTGRVRSCKCLYADTAKLRRKIKHGWHGTVEYDAYQHAKGRCQNPRNPSYPNYGGRGIRFLFKSFEDWLSELGPRPSADHSIDRIDNDGHYEPGNVRWATNVQQGENRRTNRVLIIDGQSKTFSEWERYFGWPYRGSRVRERIKLGWCVDCAFKIQHGTCEHKR
jgi:hypothetical protein